MSETRRLLLVMSVVAAGMGCARTGERALPRQPHQHAEPAVIQRQMAALLAKLKRANATLQRVAEARSDMLGLVPEVSDAPVEPIDPKDVERIREQLAEVRRQIYSHGDSFSPEVVELRRLEAELLLKLPASER